MDSTGALSELGLTVPTSAEAIRRAYLRGVRAHPPERDPEGFRRVRDAYELLKDAPWLWTTFSFRESSDEEDSVARVPAADDAAAPSPDEEAMTSIAEEVVQAAPREDEDDDDPAEESPAEESPAEESPAEELFERDLDEPSDALEQAMSRGDFERAADLLLEALGDDEMGEEPGFAPWQVLDVAIRLYAQGKFRHGESLLAKFDGWIERRQLLPSAFGTVATARLTLLKELRALPGIFPAMVVMALATSVESGQFLSAVGALGRASAVDDTFEFTFRRHAPSLYAAASRHVGAWRKPRPAARLRGLSDFPAWKFVVIAVALLQGARVLSTQSSKSLSPSDEPLVTRVGEVASTASSDGALEGWHQTISAELDATLRSGDCREVRDKWHLFLVTGKSRGYDPSFERSVQERRVTVIAKCPELEGVIR